MNKLIQAFTLTVAAAAIAIPASAASTRPLVAHNGSTMLNPQPLPPRTFLNPQPLPPRKFLNPQPLPPRIFLNPQPLPPRTFFNPQPDPPGKTF